MTSSAWVPIEPVEPSTSTDRVPSCLNVSIADIMPRRVLCDDVALPVGGEKGDVVARRSARRTGVDPRDEPSAEWGWHGTFPKAIPTAGVVTAILLCLILIGHPASWTEILFAVVPAVVILLAVVVGTLRKRNDWRR
jgi:hypothetical protein